LARAAVTALAVLALTAGRDAREVSAKDEGTPAGAAALPADLALVPPDAFSVFYVRPADLWNSEPVKYWREQLAGKGPGGKAALLEQGVQAMLGMTPAAVESVTVVFLTPANLLDGIGPGAGPASAPKARAVEPPAKPAEPVKPPRPPGDKDEQASTPAAAPVLVASRGLGLEGAPTAFVPFDLLVVTTVKPYDRRRVLRAAAPDAQENKHQGKVYYTSPNNGPTLYFVNDHTYLLGREAKPVEQVLGRPAGREARGPLAAALGLAARKRQVVAGFRVPEERVKAWKGRMEESFDPGDPGQAVLRALEPLLEARSAAVALDLGRESRLDAVLDFADEARAKQALGPAQDALVLARIFGLGALTADLRRQAEETDRAAQELELTLGLLLGRQVESALREVRVEQRGAALHASVRAGTAMAALDKAARAAVKASLGDEKVRAARLRKRSQNNLKQIGIAMHQYHDTFGTLPTAAIYGKDGKPLLSWRVAILPYIEQNQLYQQFKLDEPWDSEHNKKLLDKMPPIYAPLGVKTKEPNTTFYQAFVGPGAAFEGQRKLRLLDFLDGTSNTIMIAEAAEPVPWTKPADLAFDEKKPVPKLGGMSPDGFNVLFGDGYVRFLKKKTDEKTLRALITRAGGEVIDLEGR
jgi:hypothetical protein